MGKATKIAWCDHTFNPWWGCLKVSAGCDHCYADTFSFNRGGYNGKTKPKIWGPPRTTERRLFGPKHWREPLEWNAAAFERGARELVFCASMADVFEFHPLLDNPQGWSKKSPRQMLWDLIDQTPYLDWLLLTKRPQLIMRIVPDTWDNGFPDNVWIGTSAENQETFDQRWPWLAKVPARVRFISAEPLIGPIDLGDARPEWLISGGESGSGFRPMEMSWARSLRDQCAASGIAFFHKQGSSFKPGQAPFIDGRVHHAWPDTGLGRVGGVRAAPEDVPRETSAPSSVKRRVVLGGRVTR